MVRCAPYGAPLTGGGASLSSCPRTIEHEANGHEHEASEHEVVSAREPLDPLALVEDELLLTLPFAPRHESDCAPPAGGAA